MQSSPLDNIEHNYVHSIKITPAADRRGISCIYYVIILVPPYGSGKINTLICDGLALWNVITFNKLTANAIHMQEIVQLL